jgi:NAD(P)-dependent dehydrogenase (short-subunit alcohol dehydrogenase family)
VLDLNEVSRTVTVSQRSREQSAAGTAQRVYIPLGRAGSVDEVANLVTFLCSPRAVPSLFGRFSTDL